MGIWAAESAPIEGATRDPCWGWRYCIHGCFSPCMCAKTAGWLAAVAENEVSATAAAAHRACKGLASQRTCLAQNLQTIPGSWLDGDGNGGAAGLWRLHLGALRRGLALGRGGACAHWRACSGDGNCERRLHELLVWTLFGRSVQPSPCAPRAENSIISVIAPYLWYQDNFHRQKFDFT